MKGNDRLLNFKMANPKQFNLKLHLNTISQLKRLFKASQRKRKRMTDIT